MSAYHEKGTYILYGQLQYSAVLRFLGVWRNWQSAYPSTCPSSEQKFYQNWLKIQTLVSAMHLSALSHLSSPQRMRLGDHVPAYSHYCSHLLSSLSTVHPETPTNYKFPYILSLFFPINSFLQSIKYAYIYHFKKKHPQPFLYPTKSWSCHSKLAFRFWVSYIVSTLHSSYSLVMSGFSFMALELPNPEIPSILILLDLLDLTWLEVLSFSGFCDITSVRSFLATFSFISWIPSPPTLINIGVQYS